MLGKGLSYYFLLFSLLLASCGEDLITPFVEESPEEFLDRLDMLRTEHCYPNVAGQYVSISPPITQKGQVGDLYHATGGGCVFRSLKELWAVTHNQSALKWKDADLTGFECKKKEKPLFIFNTMHEAGPFFWREKWTIEWRQKLIEGELDNPQALLVQYQKVLGSRHIVSWKGAFQLKMLSEEVTAFQMENSIQGTNIDEEKAAGAILDIYENLKTQSPNWKFLEKD